MTSTGRSKYKDEYHENEKVSVLVLFIGWEDGHRAEQVEEDEGCCDQLQ